MKPNDKTKIRELFFARVSDPLVRSKIIQLASVLGQDNEDDYYAALYHYALSENRADLDRDHNEFVGPLGPINIVPEGSRRPRPTAPAKKVRNK